MTNASRPHGFPWERELGARALEGGSCAFRVWAPRAAGPVHVEVAGRLTAMDDAGYGIYEALVPASGGEDYWFVLGEERFPDPCSRWQPDGLRGPSRVVALDGAPDAFAPPPLDELVVYELHVGTFTAEGTFAAAIDELAGLARLGITAIELMPVAEFPGARGWGYDGVYISAAQSSYGGPHGLAELVRAAHDHGIAVLLDVVYNHVGASGVTALEAFGPYFTDKYETPWGRAINYDDPDCDPVREWVLQSACGWISAFGIDGLRLDAIHAIFDSSPEHIVAAVARRVAEVSPGALVIAESGLNDPKVMRPVQRGGWACAAAWADDYHHAIRSLVTDERDGYYVEFGQIAQLAKALHRPHIHDGGYSSFRHRRFGARADDVPPERFVVFSQNHDQVGNRAYGDRMPAESQPLAAFCTLLAPFTPMLFMGEEYGEPAPFQFFSDHIDEEIATATRDGRRQEFAAFAQFGEEIPDPQDPATFEHSKLTRRRNPAVAGLYERLMAARRLVPNAEAEAIEFDESERWLRCRRGPFTLLMNFGSEGQRLACDAGELVLGTDADVRLEGGWAELPPLSGALLR
jgi:maltooligosyltrehalose trehalohydrolase